MPENKYWTDGWISPAGKYIFCTGDNHRYEAKRILKGLGIDITVPPFVFGLGSKDYNYWEMDRHLQALGYIKITNQEFYRYNKEEHPVRMTKKQLDFIFDYLEYFDKLNKPFECLFEKYQNYRELVEANPVK
jgi:hypothetical protein